MAKGTFDLCCGIIILLEVTNGQFYQGAKGWDIRGFSFAKPEWRERLHFGLFHITKDNKTSTMEIGVDSFASALYGANEKNAMSPVDAMEQLLGRMELADQAGLDVFGIGEHHKKEFLDSATVVILAAAAQGPNAYVSPVR